MNRSSTVIDSNGDRHAAKENTRIVNKESICTLIEPNMALRDKAEITREDENVDKLEDSGFSGDEPDQKRGSDSLYGFGSGLRQSNSKNRDIHVSLSSGDSGGAINQNHKTHCNMNEAIRERNVEGNCEGIPEPEGEEDDWLDWNAIIESAEWLKEDSSPLSAINQLKMDDGKLIQNSRKTENSRSCDKPNEESQEGNVQGGSTVTNKNPGMTPGNSGIEGGIIRAGVKIEISISPYQVMVAVAPQTRTTRRTVI